MIHRTLRLPALSLVHLLQRPSFSHNDWRVGATEVHGDTLYFAAPCHHTNGGPVARVGAASSEGRTAFEIAYDLTSDRFVAFDREGDAVAVELRPDWSEIDDVSTEAPETRSRMVGALGIRGWMAFHALKVGIVGAGGLGAALAVELVADGVRDLVVCDPDKYDLSNIGRLPAGFGEEVVGRPKPLVLAEKLTAVEPHVSVVAVSDEFETWATFKKFVECDVIVCACDSALTRRAVARFAARYLVPAISIGTGVFVGRDEPLKMWEGAAWIPDSECCLSCLMGLSAEVATEADRHREVGSTRLGSLRSLNLEPVAWAMRTIEDIATATLLESVSVRGNWSHGRYTVTRGGATRLGDCACPLLAAGDAGL